MSSTLSAVPSTPLREDARVIGLVGLAHMTSHYSQLLLAPLFPWLKDAFHVSYTQLGFLMTLFFVVSCAVQAASGFLVDRHGPRPVLFGGLALLGCAAFGFASAPNYLALMFWAMVAGMGNGVFHPVNYTLINRKVSAPRLGHAYSFHGVTGSLGWAITPAVLVPVALAHSWRLALVVAGSLIWAVLALAWSQREQLALPPAAAPRRAKGGAPAPGGLDFLRIPAIWLCFWFFLCSGMILTAVQAYAPQAARQLHAMPLALTAMCLTVYMVCSAAGVLAGGFLAHDPQRCERVVGWAFAAAAVVAAVLCFAPVPAAAVPALFGAMGFCTGLAGPSRDLLVKRSTPEHASGRIYGVVYSGLDIGQAIGPLLFGMLMDRQNFQGIWIGLMTVQLLLVASAFRVRRVRRTASTAA